MKRLGLVALALVLAAPALSQSDSPIRSRIGAPEYGGGYREDIRGRIGPRGDSFRQPYDIRGRIAGDDTPERRALAQSTPGGSSPAARRAQRERTLRLKQQQPKAVPAPQAPRPAAPPPNEPKSY